MKTKNDYVRERAQRELLRMGVYVPLELLTPELIKRKKIKRKWGNGKSGNKSGKRTVYTAPSYMTVRGGSTGLVQQHK